MKRKIKKAMKRVISVALVAVMGCTLLAGCKGSGSGSDDDVITITVFSELANLSGEQTGWSAKMLKEKFNIVLNIVPSADGVFETRMESGYFGDIVVFGSDGENYTRAVEAGLLYDWNEDDLVKEYGPDIYENMQAALQKNAQISESITGEPTVYGFGHNVAQDGDSGHETFFYTWDIRWDLYKELGYPEYKNMDDMINVFKAMKEICPTDDNGNETYAVSLWPDWDGDMVMYVKSFATAYWGYDETAMGLYDSNTGTYYAALEENGPYLQSLKFFNQLYQNDLIDPNSMTQTYTNMYEKVQAGGTFFSIFNYSGCLGYNSDAHVGAGKMMTSLIPDEAKPIVYGMNPAGGNRIWAIGSNTKYPEECMELINWLCTPEGVMTYNYGPEGLCWYYDEDGFTHWTEFGEEVYFKRDTIMTGDYEGTGDFDTGCIQINNTTWSTNAFNPDSNGERYSYETWNSYAVGASSDIFKDWSAKVNSDSTQNYMEAHDYTLCPATSYKLASKTGEFKTTWTAVTDIITDYSWKAIYAETDAEFEQIVSEMLTQAKSYGYDECVTWALEQANLRHQAEEEATAAK